MSDRNEIFNHFFFVLSFRARRRIYGPLLSARSTFDFVRFIFHRLLPIFSSLYNLFSFVATAGDVGLRGDWIFIFYFFPPAVRRLSVAVAAGGPDRVRWLFIGAVAVVVVVVTELFGRKCLLAVTRFSRRHRLLLHSFCVCCTPPGPIGSRLRDDGAFKSLC